VSGKCSKPDSPIPLRNDIPSDGTKEQELDKFQRRWVKACQKMCMKKNVICFDGMFIKRFTWIPSFVQDWLETNTTSTDAITLTAIELFPPVYNKWMSHPKIQLQLQRNVELFMKHPPSYTNKNNYRMVLQLCFDLNMSAQFESIMSHIQTTHQLTWKERALLYNIF
jgi:hypothetical protein